jgi:branched-chain amino acid transport system permease protein
MAAMAVGIPLQTVWAVVWAVTGIIALVAGLLWAERVSVSFTLIEAVMKALPVILIGGLTSIPGAIVGGLVIGVGEKLGEIYLADVFGGQGIELWFAYFMALMFLVFRPQGMFGEKLIERV